MDASVEAVCKTDGAAPAPATRKPDSTINVDEGADQATTIGLGNDVHFARPRTFRTENFNGEHIDIEPLAADPPETSATPNP